MLFIYLVISNTVKIKLANDPFGFGHLFLKIITKRLNYNLEMYDFKEVHIYEARWL